VVNEDTVNGVLYPVGGLLMFLITGRPFAEWGKLKVEQRSIVGHRSCSYVTGFAGSLVRMARVPTKITARIRCDQSVN